MEAQPQASPISPALVAEAQREVRVADPGRASIREIRRLIDWLEARQSTRFIRMEMGIPGLAVDPRIIAAEQEALAAGVAAAYPPVAGIEPLKRAISTFLKRFANVDVAPEGCIPTVGSINGSFAAFMVAGRAHAGRDTILLLNPGFPLHAVQARMVGLASTGFDIAAWRGEALEAKLDEVLSGGRIAALLYSNPNNPTWMCLTQDELATIARVARRHDVVVIEDLAYFGMDFREHRGTPGSPPWQPTVARESDEWIMLVSSSKAFSYAGQRIGMMAVSDALWARSFPDLERWFGYTRFGDALLLGTLYPMTAGAAHSAQYGLLAALEAANSGEYDFVSGVAIYAAKAARMKEHFLANGFTIVYDTDVDRPIGDGFYFTVGWPEMSGEELVAELLPWGISAIALGTTGAERTNGIRACVSLVPMEMIDELGRRLAGFAAAHGSRQRRADHSERNAPSPS